MPYLLCLHAKKKQDTSNADEGKKDVISEEKADKTENAEEDAKEKKEEIEEIEEEESDDGSPEGYITSRSKFENEAGKLLDLSMYNDLYVNETYDNYKNYSYSMPNAKKPKLDYAVSFESGAEIKIPAKFKEITESGWTPDYNTDDRKLRTNTYAEPILYNDDGEKIVVTIINNTDSEILYADADVIAIKLESKYYSGVDLKTYAACPDFSIDGKINKDATVKDVIDAFGQPLYFSASVNLDKEGNYEYTIVRIYYNIPYMSNYGKTGIMFEFSGDENKLLYAKYMYDED